MPLASYADANDWLDGTKLKFVSDDDAAPESRQADTLVLSVLSPVFPDHAEWWINDSTPTPPYEYTPALIRSIVGALMASYRYAKAYSEETDSESGYAAWLRNQAMMMLGQVVDGTLKLYDTIYENDASYSEDMFWPNDTTRVTEDEVMGLAPFGFEAGDPLRSFTMDKTF